MFSYRWWLSDGDEIAVIAGIWAKGGREETTHKKGTYFSVCLSRVRKMMIDEMPGDKMLLFLLPSVRKGADLL